MPEAVLVQLFLLLLAMGHLCLWNLLLLALVEELEDEELSLWVSPLRLQFHHLDIELHSVVVAVECATTWLLGYSCRRQLACTQDFLLDFDNRLRGATLQVEWSLV